MLAALFIFGGFTANNVSAQRRVQIATTISQPVVVHRVYYRRYYDPFWRGTLWDPYYGMYDPYLYDPYLRAQRDKYYKEKAVRDSRRNLAKSREKYAADGYLTPKVRIATVLYLQREHEYIRCVAEGLLARLAGLVAFPFRPLAIALFCCRASEKQCFWHLDDSYAGRSSCPAACGCADWLGSSKRYAAFLAPKLIVERNPPHDCRANDVLRQPNHARTVEQLCANVGRWRP